jgi:peptide deformylase
MLLPIYAYGQPVLKKKAEPIAPDYPELQTLIENMYDTMYHAKGVGLAAPQVGLSIRLFLVDTVQLKEKDKEMQGDGIRQVFINAEILEFGGKEEPYEEGCLSIPNITGDVERPAQVRVRYQNEQFEVKEEVFTGFEARVIQHEYDHIEGVLFTEKLKPLKRNLIRRKLEKIRKGDVSAEYKMKFYQI